MHPNYKRYQRRLFTPYRLDELSSSSVFIWELRGPQDIYDGSVLEPPLSVTSQRLNSVEPLSHSTLPQTVYHRYHWYYEVCETSALYIRLSLMHTPVGNFDFRQVLV